MSASVVLESVTYTPSSESDPENEWMIQTLLLRIGFEQDLGPLHNSEWVSICVRSQGCDFKTAGNMLGLCCEGFSSFVQPTIRNIQDLPLW